MRILIRASLPLIMIGFAACSSTTLVAPGRITDYCAKRDSVVRPISGNTLDDDFEIMSRVLPGGFAGLTTTQVFFTEPSLADSARSVARIVSACPGDDLDTLWAHVQTGQVVKVKYDWVQLRHWYTLNIGPTSGLVVSDINETTNRLVYGFLTQANIDAFKSAALAAGIPSDAMSFFIASPIPAF